MVSKILYFFVYFFTFRYSNGTGIDKAKIDIAGRNHTIYSTATGDYFRLLKPGDYQVTVTVANRNLVTPVHITDDSTLVMDFVVGKDSITAQTVRAMRREEIANATKDKSNDEVNKASTTIKRTKTRSDNLAAAAVIVTIGCIVCILAGIVLYRKVKELRAVEKGYGYAKINPENFRAEEP